MSKKTKEAPLKSRTLAFAFAAFGGWGSGHAYLGVPKRGAIFLGIAVLTLIVAAVAFWPLADAIGLRTIVVICLALIAGSWIASVVDAMRIRPSSYGEIKSRDIAAWVVLALACLYGGREILQRGTVRSYDVHTTGMRPALRAGDGVVADMRRSSTIRRGDVVVFMDPTVPADVYMYRVVGLANDMIEVKYGALFINGWKVPTCRVARSGTTGLYVEFLDGKSYSVIVENEGAEYTNNEGPFFTKQGEYFVVGDDRLQAIDSRKWSPDGRGQGAKAEHVRGIVRWTWFRDGTGLANVDARVAVLPTEWSQHRAEFDACIAKRPPDDQTRPPAR